MNYQEYTPSLHLRPFIEKIWTLECNASDAYPMKFHGTPNGAGAIIINCRETGYKVEFNNSIIVPPEVFVMQPYTPWKVFVEGCSSSLGVFFKAGSLHTILKCPMAQIVGQIIGLEAFLESRSVRVLREKVAEAFPEERVQLIEAFLSRYFCHLPRKYEMVASAVEMMRQHNGGLLIERISSKLGVTRQAMAHQFAKKVGVSPKYYSRLIHFNAMQQFLMTHPKTSWLQLTYEFNYCDQSHLIKDYYDFTGITPKEYAALNSIPVDNGVMPDINLKSF